MCGFGVIAKHYVQYELWDCSVARRSWARQSSGALLCRIPKSGDSGYGFRL